MEIEVWMFSVRVCVHRKKKKLFWISCVWKKKKRGTVKEILLASAVALFLWDNCFIICCCWWWWWCLYFSGNRGGGGRGKKKSLSKRKLEARFSRRDSLPVALTTPYLSSAYPRCLVTLILWKLWIVNFTSKWIPLLFFFRKHIRSALWWAETLSGLPCSPLLGDPGRPHRAECVW